MPPPPSTFDIPPACDTNVVCRSLQDRGFPWPIHTSAKSFYTAARPWTWKEDSEVAVTYCTANHHGGNGEYILCGLYCGYMFVIVRQLLITYVCNILLHSMHMVCRK